MSIGDLHILPEVLSQCIYSTKMSGTDHICVRGGERRNETTPTPREVPGLSIFLSNGMVPLFLCCGKTLQFSQDEQY